MLLNPPVKIFHYKTVLHTTASRDWNGTHNKRCEKYLTK